MARKGRYLIPSFLAAGLLPFGAFAGQAPEETGDKEDSLFDGLKEIVANLEQSHQFTLAQHQSHQSHSSHQSHRSYGYRLTPADNSAGTEYASLISRNEASTPATSVLPSTPAIAKKLKILPGNSKKFGELVARLQIALLVEGYEAGEPNGQLHARTIAALYRYQSDRGIVPSGKITNEVLSSLGIVAQ
jgi:His-Xaa-Ser repeat protein HxsA